LAFLRLAGEAYNEKYVVMDLNGHDQRFGNLYTVPVGENDFGWMQAWGHSFGSCITSALPAVLYAVQEGDLINKPEVPWKATFRGAVSLVKSGANTLTLAGVNSTTGRLEVAEGRLDFAGDGSWANAREIAVSGGVLALGRDGIISREADVYISGGSLEIAEGVRQTVRHLYISDGEGGLVKMRQGYYDSGSAGGFVTGGGVLRVRGDGGLTVVVR
jgi:autotransporter-associated beta strand protein